MVNKIIIQQDNGKIIIKKGQYTVDILEGSHFLFVSITMSKYPLAIRLNSYFIAHNIADIRSKEATSPLLTRLIYVLKYLLFLIVDGHCYRFLATLGFSNYIIIIVFLRFKY